MSQFAAGLSILLSISAAACSGGGSSPADGGSDGAGGGQPSRQDATEGSIEAAVEGGAEAAADAGGAEAAKDASEVSPDTGTSPDAGASPDAQAPSPQIPAAKGTCPDFANGNVTFVPSGIPPRAVKLWVGAGSGGPLVFYWHGTGSSPDEAAYGLGSAAVAAITAAGGVVAAPVHDPNAGQWPWYLVSGTQEDDLIVADEVLACAVAKKGIDTRRIHVSGMSAGGLMTSQMSLRRSSYVASAAPYSGGIIAGLPPYQNPANKLSALIFWGGTSDVVVISFQDASLAYSDLLRSNGNSTILCNHGGGHTIPQSGVPAVWRFFQDHPFGTNPTPYATAGLPSVFPSYCTL